MKKAIVVLLLLAGCAPSPMQVRQAVVEKFNTAEVAMVSDGSYEFVVRATNGEIWFVDGRGPTTNVQCTLLFAAPR